MKVTTQWFSDRMQQPITLARWGTSALRCWCFPPPAATPRRSSAITSSLPAASSSTVDASSCTPATASPGKAMVAGSGSPAHRMWLLNQFHECIANEVVPAIHSDLGGHQPPIVTAGASIGAFNALAVMCRYPQAFGVAIGMSGTYKLERFFEGEFNHDLYVASPVHFLPDPGGAAAGDAAARLAILASGQGAWEDVSESWLAGERAREQGHPQPGGPMGTRVGPRMADLVQDAAAVSRRGDLTAEPRFRRCQSCRTFMRQPLT